MNFREICRFYLPALYSSNLHSKKIMVPQHKTRVKTDLTFAWCWPSVSRIHLSASSWECHQNRFPAIVELSSRLPCRLLLVVPQRPGDFPGKSPFPALEVLLGRGARLYSTSQVDALSPRCSAGAKVWYSYSVPCVTEKIAFSWGRRLLLVRKTSANCSENQCNWNDFCE